MSRRPLVPQTADRLRERIYACEEGEQIGSLSDLAREFGVGIITVQQAARVLEHEGLLEVRRGPGGGYYGRRPDAAALERLLAAYLRTNPASFGEALNITSLLFNEICAAAAACQDEALRDELAAFVGRIETSDSESERGAFEADFQDLLFRMVRWPLFELLTQVTLRFAGTREVRVISGEALAAWKAGRHRIIAAILAGDGELARFEAERSNRRAVMGDGK